MRKTATRIIAGAMIAAGVITFTGITPASAAPVASMSTSGYGGGCDDGCGDALDGIVDLADDLLDEAYDLLDDAGDLVDCVLDEVLDD
ncbi:hypothetical protein OG394_11080 [Kribbella sp. NBC_01245]|uniref:hypothetical protein n=1 Tax=Kribbella sp. NBC_01245 TaxID=2903578 RepID=UPI002E28339F|nr:hypothetical protein [Kribbella sp. NBC_01245]